MEEHPLDDAACKTGAPIRGQDTVAHNGHTNGEVLQCRGD